jgi:predicted Zn-dependent protease
MANIHYKKREYSKAIEQYEILVNNYPTSVMYSVNLAKLYISRGKFITGIKVLNKLVENNPDAKNDKRVKPFRLLMQIIK